MENYIINRIFNVVNSNAIELTSLIKYTYSIGNKISKNTLSLGFYVN